MMRYLVFLLLISLGLGLFQTAVFAQDSTDIDGRLALGGGLYAEIIPEKFVTMLGETPPEYRERLEWVTIPAVFEMVTETIIVQEAYPIVKVNPAHFAADGTLISKATAAIETVPALTKDVARRVVKTPARRVQRLIPNGYHAPTIRKRVAVETYIIRDETGAEIARYEDPVAFADFVNGL